MVACDGLLGQTVALRECISRFMARPRVCLRFRVGERVGKGWGGRGALSLCGSFFVGVRGKRPSLSSFLSPGGQNANGFWRRFIIVLCTHVHDVTVKENTAHKKNESSHHLCYCILLSVVGVVVVVVSVTVVADGTDRCSLLPVAGAGKTGRRESIRTPHHGGSRQALGVGDVLPPKLRVRGLVSLKRWTFRCVLSARALCCMMLGYRACFARVQQSGGVCLLEVN